MVNIQVCQLWLVDSTTLDKGIGTSSANTECLACENSKVAIFTGDHQGKES